MSKQNNQSKSATAAEKEKNTAKRAKTSAKSTHNSAKAAQNLTNNSDYTSNIGSNSAKSSINKTSWGKTNSISNLRTDMAAELTGHLSALTDPTQVKKSRVDVDKALSRKIGKAEGTYITLETGIVTLGLDTRYPTLSKAISGAIRELAPKPKTVLVVCLGNPRLTADALGRHAFDSLEVTRHLPDELKTNKKISIAALCPNVMGATGIESFDIIKGVVDRIKPQLVIAVDSLASATVGRIGSAFQICSSGITPGSGVANHRVRLDRSSLGVDVISVGVPLVVYATTIIAEAAGEAALETVSDEIRDLIVTPKDIDVLVAECGKVIAAAINMTFLD